MSAQQIQKRATDFNLNSRPSVFSSKKTLKGFIAIEGMTCSACTNTVEKCLVLQKGVVQAKVSLLLNRAEVLYCTDEISLDVLAEEIENVGFGARVLSQNGDQVTEANHLIANFVITDKNFAFSQRNHVTIMAFEGVVSVSEANAKIKIVYDSQVTGIRKMNRGLNEIGIPCELEEGESDLKVKHKALTESQDLETKKWISLLKVSCLFAFPVFLITMVLTMASESKRFFCFD